MSTSSTSSNSNALPRLGPAWRSRGFQPPPAVPSDPRDESYQNKLNRSRSGSSGSLGEKGSSGGGSNSNSFSAFLSLEGSDEDNGANGYGGGRNGNEDAGAGSRIGSSGGFKSRSDAFMGSGSRSTGGFGPSRNSSNSSSGAFKSTGRSLADLAARTPSGGASRTHSGGYRSSGDGGGFSRERPNDDADKKIIRYTRERLLSMRPQPRDPDNIPSHLKYLQATSIVAKSAQEPVCFDDFDADEIWAQATTTRRSTSSGPANKANNSNSSPQMSLRGLAEGSLRVRSDIDGLGGNSGGGRWQRGVALPPASEEGGKRGGTGGRRLEDSDDPNDLWDDPVNISDGGADLSQFGALLDDEPGSRSNRSGSIGSSGSGGGMFDLAGMSEAAKRFESELHGDRQRDSDEDGLGSSVVQNVDPKRPLSHAGTTIRSGSGDDVNVFEDFGAPAEPKTIPAVDENTDSEPQENASSRLMKMIGVQGPSEEETGKSKLMSAWRSESPENETQAQSNPIADSNLGGFGSLSSVPSNPWGSSILTGGSDSVPLTETIDQNAAAMKAAEEEKKRAEEVEKQRQANLQAQIAAQQQAAQVEAQRQQASAQQTGRTQYNTQVEQILLERIGSVLEGAWGRTDLGTLLSTLHREDPRVAPLLGSIDDLKALLSRHSNRVAIVNGPGFGVEMVVLVMTNAQFQQQQMQNQRQEELQMQQQMIQKMQAMKMAEDEARAREQAAAMAAKQKSVTITNDPWYYADPQGNIQGPFKGEEMRQWLDAGYFKGDLPISQNPSGSFHLLTSLFPDPSIAFQPPPPNDTDKEEEAKKLAAIEKEKEEKELAEKAAQVAEMEKAEAQRKASEERLRKEKEAAVKLAKEKEEQSAKESNPNSSSSQLKMLLGLNNGGDFQTQENETEKIVVASAADPTPTNTQKPSNANNASSIAVPPTSSQKNVQPQSDNQRTNTVVNPPVPAPAPVPALPAWGGAATAKAGVKKSMSEIQLEEARVAARVAKQTQKVGRSSSGGWANIAASGGGGTGWGSGAVKAVRQSSGSVQASVPGAPAFNSASAQVRSKPAVKTGVPGQSVPAPKPVQQQSKASAIEDFGVGGKMSPALESWCKEQMKKLNGSDDLTLIAFCMTLTDPVEIRQYLTAYLGSSAQVGSFATEFINRKGGGRPKQEEWESAGNAKKGRKKKANAK